MGAAEIGKAAIVLLAVGGGREGRVDGYIDRWINYLTYGSSIFLSENKLSGSIIIFK